MKPYAVVDMHCDTLTKSINDSLNKDYDFSLKKIPDDVRWAQFFAVFINDGCKFPMDYFKKYHQSFQTQVEKYSDKLSFCKNYSDILKAWNNNRCAGFLTVENGNILEGKLKNVEVLASSGVKILTLVWNGINEIGSGNNTDRGLTDFGKEVIPVLEENNIIIDVSHLNNNGFYDFLKIAKKPFVASHSNSRTICNHKRNLTDELIMEIIKRDGIIGINFYKDFVSDGDDYTYMDLYKHIERMLALGAGNNIALGSDFDGATMVECTQDICKVKKLYSWICESRLTKEEVDRIFSGNALRFIGAYMK